MPASSALSPDDTLRALIEAGSTNKFCSNATAGACDSGCRDPNLAQIEWAVSEGVFSRVRGGQWWFCVLWRLACSEALLALALEPCLTPTCSAALR